MLICFDSSIEENCTFIVIDYVHKKNNIRENVSGGKSLRVRVLCEQEGVNEHCHCKPPCKNSWMTSLHILCVWLFFKSLLFLHMDKVFHTCAKSDILGWLMNYSTVFLWKTSALITQHSTNVDLINQTEVFFLDLFCKGRILLSPFSSNKNFIFCMLCFFLIWFAYSVIFWDVAYVLQVLCTFFYKDHWLVDFFPQVSFSYLSKGKSYYDKNNLENPSCLLCI